LDTETVDMEDTTVDETPNWQAQTSESVGADPTGDPDPAPEPEPQAVEAEAKDDTDAAPLSTEPGDHGPSFAPTLDDAEDFTPGDNTSENQEVTDSVEPPPVPHLDNEAPGGADDDTGDDDSGPPIPTITDPDPVSPATQAAILDAQSAMDDDERDPSGG